MNVTKACLDILNQLNGLVSDISEQDFAKPSATLNNSTIGQHLRHTLEFFICFEQGYERGVINYDKRNHDKLIESDKFIALAAINRIQEFVKDFDWEKKLTLEVGYDLEQEKFVSIHTNAVRELVYNIEHAVHHMAIIKIGVKEVANYIQLPKDFGIAASTIRYQETVKSH